MQQQRAGEVNQGSTSVPGAPPNRAPGSTESSPNPMRTLVTQRKTQGLGGSMLCPTGRCSAQLWCPNKHHRLLGLSYRNLFPHSSGGWKSKTKVSAGWVSPVPSLLSLQTALVPGVFPQSSLCVSVS